MSLGTVTSSRELFRVFTERSIMALNQSYGSSASSASSYSQTYGTAATQAASQQAAIANSAADAAWRQAADYNAQQAEINRQWQERMANTVYQRTVKDMKAAGINPILAAQMGLGTASIGSGATASMSNPATYMGKTFADQTSASQSNGWSNSESGLATFLTTLGTTLDAIVANMSSSKTIELSLNGLLGNNGKDDDGYYNKHSTALEKAQDMGYNILHAGKSTQQTMDGKRYIHYADGHYEVK